MKRLGILASLLFLPLICLANAQEKEITIKGMTCPVCEKVVTKALKKLPGIEQVVTVDHQSGVAKVIMKDGMKLDKDLVTKAIKETGFTVATIQ